MFNKELKDRKEPAGDSSSGENSGRERERMCKVSEQESTRSVQGTKVNPVWLDARHSEGG